MSEVIIKFNIPTESRECKDAQDGAAWKQVVWEHDNYLRNLIKHGEMSDDCRGYLQGARDRLHQEVDGAELFLD